MMGYSWQAFLVERSFYAGWVDRGRPHPHHERWASYLQWVAEKVGLRVTLGTVFRIERDKNKWRVRYRPKTGPERSLEGPGLVITGPGDPVRLPGQPQNSPFVYDGRNFWTNLDKFNGLEDAVIGVIGSGETAAAIVVALLHRVSKDVMIQVINRQGAVFTRGESYDENRLFSDPSSWEQMRPDDRREFMSRTDRGVFSVKTKGIIDHAENVTHQLMDVERMEVRNGRAVLYGKGKKNFAFDYLVNTTAFDPLSFRRMMPPGIEKKLSHRSKVEESIQPDISVADLTPKLHLPMLAAISQGPGFPNLSSLGMLSDRILKSYVPISGGGK
jgi:mycobactin lysine-N-oxygenase